MKRMIMLACASMFIIGAMAQVPAAKPAPKDSTAVKIHTAKKKLHKKAAVKTDAQPAVKPVPTTPTK